jgi:ethanolamine permease
MPVAMACKHAHGYGFAGTLTDMPKRSVSGRAGPGSETSTRPIGTWVAAGLSLAVIGFATQFGVFTVSAAVFLAPMVYVFARLRGHAPDARTTSDFVGAVLGERFGVFAGLVQLVAYLLLAVMFARTLAFGLLGMLDVFLGVVPTPGSTSTTPILAVGSITAVVAAGVIAHLLSTRGISWVVAILAAAGMLAYFYIAVALVALIATGSQPRDPSIAMLSPPQVTYGLVDAVLAVGLIVGFEVVTTINRDVRSVGRSMGLALALTAGCALIVAAALSPHMFGTDPVPNWELPWLAAAYLGNAGSTWWLIGSVALKCAGLLMLMFAAVRVARRWADQLTLPLPDRAQLAGVVAIVVVLLVVEWLWSGATSSTLGDVGSLLLLAVYVCAAHACARIPRTGPRIAAEAGRLLIWVVVAGVVVVEWPPLLGIAAVVLIVAAAIATKTKRLPRTPKVREELPE